MAEGAGMPGPTVATQDASVTAAGAAASVVPSPSAAAAARGATANVASRRPAHDATTNGADARFTSPTVLMPARARQRVSPFRGSRPFSYDESADRSVQVGPNDTGAPIVRTMVSADEIVRFILETYPDTIIARADGAIFFSCDESNWPNFATIVTTDAYDTREGGPAAKADLGREGVFRLNIGLGHQTFERVTADIEDPDYAALDTLLPHPVYAPQHWVGILNPSAETFEIVVKPLLEEAHARVARKGAVRRPGGDSPAASG